MTIDAVNIENFRCFENYSIYFGKEITVLIGKNGTGKSNLLSSIRRGLSFMFASPNIKFGTLLNQSNNCIVRGFEIWDTRFDELERRFVYPTSIKYKGTFGESLITWDFLKAKQSGSLYPTLYKEALDVVLKSHNQNPATSFLPLVAFFSDSYPHVESNLGKKAMTLIKMPIMPRDFGYYGWDESTNCVQLWQHRFIRTYNLVNDAKNDKERIQDQIDLYEAQISNKDEQDGHRISEWEDKIETLQEKLDQLSEVFSDQKDIKELNFITERIMAFCQPHPIFEFINPEFEVLNVSVNRSDKKDFSVEFLFKNGKTMNFNTLPQGYKRLLSMVFDISYRAYILNGDCEPKGIVLIDEIELHLHPTLQQEVLDRFKNTFPDIQFIVSTHSPIVLGNLKADGEKKKVIRLENDGSRYFNETIENVYGIDYNTSLTEVMDSSLRASSLDTMIDSYVILKINNMDKEADKVYNEILRAAGKNNMRVKDEIEKKLRENQ